MKIIDINKFSSVNNSKAYFLDTNVLYWYVYPRYGLARKSVLHQAQPYYDFVDKLVAAGNPLFTSVYNISELLNVIKKNEFEIFSVANPNYHYTLKDYRKDSNERRKLQTLLNTTLNNASAVCSILDFNFTYFQLKNFAQTLSSHRCDPFDYVILNNCIDKEYTNIISDDNDFTTISEINLYTANAQSLNTHWLK